MLHTLLEWLHGKKAIFLSIAFLILTYLTKENILADNLSILVAGILTVLGGGADIATSMKLGTKRK